MKFKLEIKCDNAAFDSLEQEIYNILMEAAKKVSEGQKSFTLLDSNGNTVGAAMLTGKR